MKLTDKQKKFIEEYLIDLNATQAAIRAGYKTKYPDRIGHELLEKTRVKEAIQEAIKKREERTNITQDKVLQELASIGFARIDDFLRVDDFEVITGYEPDEESNSDKLKPIKKKIRAVEIYKTDEIDKRKIKAISEIKETKEGISLKLNDKLKALELLGKHLGMFTDKVEIGNKDNETFEVNIKVVE